MKLSENLKNTIKKPKLNFSWIKRIKISALWSVAAYLHLLVVLPIIFKRKDEFVRYHIRQGLALLAVWAVFGFSFFLPVVPWLFGFLVLILTFAGITNVIMSKERPLPLIGKLAEKF